MTPERSSPRSRPWGAPAVRRATPGSSPIATASRFHRPVWDLLRAGHHEERAVAVFRLTGCEAEAAVSQDDRGDAVPAEDRAVRIPVDLFKAGTSKRATSRSTFYRECAFTSSSTSGSIFLARWQIAESRLDVLAPQGRELRLKDRDLGVPALRRVRGAEKRLPRMRCEARSRSGPSATPRGRRSSGASLRSGRTPSRPRLAALRSKIKGERRRTGCPASVPRGGNFQTLERGQFSSVDKNVNSR